MHKDIQAFSEILKNGSFETTYKFIWAKAIVECCMNNPESVYIRYEDIGKIMCRYYWNQMDKFPNFNQADPKHKQQPALISLLKKYRTIYLGSNQDKNKKGQEMRFEKIEKKLNINWKEVTKKLKENVAERFQNVGKIKYDIYTFDKSLDYIIIDSPDVIAEYGEILLSLINYGLIQKLEAFNTKEKLISEKVRIIDDKKPIRRNLIKYHRYLDVLGKHCYWCNTIKNDGFSVDHVIPLSLMPEDFLWNFVYAHRTCNSSKNARVVAREEIVKLHNRNINLLDELKKANFDIYDPELIELEDCIKNDMLKQRWFQIA